jgi:hypothetical protein
MAVENATTPDQLDASLPRGTDFKNEGDNHIRLLKDVLKNTLQGIVGVASAPDAAEIVTPGSSKIFTALRVFQQVTARIAPQTVAETGADNSLLMTPLGTAQYISNRVASQEIAEAGTNNTALMTSLAVKRYVDARRATREQAEAASDDALVMSPLRVGQSSLKVFNDNYTARTASNAQALAGASDIVTMTPLKDRQAGDARYLQLAQTTAFTRTVLDDASAAAVKTTLGIVLSDSTTSASSTAFASSAAVRNAFNEGSKGPTAGQNFLLFNVFGALNNYGNTITAITSVVCINQGTITVYGQHSQAPGATATTSTYRVSKNGVVLQSWNSTSQSLSTRTLDVAVTYGDVIVWESSGQAGNFRIYSGTSIHAVTRG